MENRDTIIIGFKHKEKMQTQIMSWKKIPLNRNLRIVHKDTQEFFTDSITKIVSNNEVITDSGKTLHKSDYDLIIYPLKPLPTHVGSVINIFGPCEDDATFINGVEITLVRLPLGDKQWFHFTDNGVCYIYIEQTLAFAENWEWIQKPENLTYLQRIENNIDEDTNSIFNMIADRGVLKNITLKALSDDATSDDKQEALMKMSQILYKTYDSIHNYSHAIEWKVAHSMGDEAILPLGNLLTGSGIFSSYDEAKKRLDQQRADLLSGQVPKTSLLWDFRIEYRITTHSQWEPVED